MNLPDIPMTQRSSPQHQPFPDIITSCSCSLYNLEHLPPYQHQDCVSQLLVADHFHKDLHERCNTPCDFLRICYQISLPSEQHIGPFLGGWVLDYCLFYTHVHACTISTQLWKHSWGTTSLEHPLQPGIWLWLRYSLTLRRTPSFLLPPLNTGSLNVSERVSIHTCGLKDSERTKISFLHWCRSEHRLAKTAPLFPGKSFLSGD